MNDNILLVHPLLKTITEDISVGLICRFNRKRQSNNHTRERKREAQEHALNLLPCNDSALIGHTQTNWRF